MNQLLERSNAIKAKLLKLATPDKASKPPSPKALLGEIEQGAAQFLGLKSESDWVSVEVRDHFLDLYQRGVVGLVKRLCAYEQKLTEQEEEWKATIDKLIEDQQTARQTIERLEERGERTTTEFNKLKAEHYQLMNENKDKSEKLDREIANSVNLEYLKNIIMSYFMTSDPKVQINLIRVVFQAMKFSDDEQTKVLEAHSANNQSAFSRVVGSLF